MLIAQQLGELAFARQHEYKGLAEKRKRATEPQIIGIKQQAGGLNSSFNSKRCMPELALENVG